MYDMKNLNSTQLIYLRHRLEKANFDVHKIYVDHDTLICKCNGDTEEIILDNHDHIYKVHDSVKAMKSKQDHHYLISNTIINAILEGLSRSSEYDNYLVTRIISNKGIPV